MSDALRAAAFGYRFAFAHLPPLWMLAAWRIAMTVALLILVEAVVPEIGGDPLADLRFAGKYLVLALLRMLLYAATLSAVAIAWQRAAAGDAALGRRLRPEIDRRSGAYFLTVARLTLAAATALVAVWLAGNGLGRLLAGQIGVFFGPPSKALFLVGLAGVLWALARLVPAVSQAALAGGRSALGVTWRRSAGHAGALVALMVLCLAPLPVAGRLLVHAAAGYGGGAEFAGRLLFELAAVLSMLVFLAALSRYDRVAMPDGAPVTSAGRDRRRR